MKHLHHAQHDRQLLIRRPQSHRHRRRLQQLFQHFRGRKLAGTPNLSHVEFQHTGEIHRDKCAYLFRKYQIGAP